MQWEMSDYRNKDPKRDTTWLEWQVPKDLVAGYIMKLTFWTFILPIVLFNALLAPIPFALTILLLDYTSYIKWKND